VIKKLLIANRGEIVSRIAKTCSRAGIATVAVYSSADEAAPFVRSTDEAYLIGPANPMKSYLNIGAIIEIVKKTGSDAVHPGYGFLAENADFAEAVQNASAAWVGPPPHVLRTVESKMQAKSIASGVGVPVIPGTFTAVRSAEEVKSYASAEGYPLLLKLDRGGGGKGIETVSSDNHVEEVFGRITRIGTAAFANADCFIEKILPRPRHIEIQFLADGQGNCFCLGERECSIQRRYQKIIEETPSPVVTPEERNTLYRHTKNLVAALSYVGAGTVEYLRSAAGDYYFMEVNARIQVEHPVTEMVTGTDIVDCQLRIASGESLYSFNDKTVMDGHAIEARVYAEDPETFMPSPGTISGLTLPEEVSGALRLDHSLAAGCSVAPYYDPMLLKVIAWDKHRSGAVERLKSALQDIVIEGVQTTISANLKILDHVKFLRGEADLTFFDEEIWPGS
jgi:acetyl/propionyl-CoA carboxylase alpha subunit